MSDNQSSFFSLLNYFWYIEFLVIIYNLSKLQFFCTYSEKEVLDNSHIQTKGVYYMYMFMTYPSYQDDHSLEVAI